MEVMLNRLKGSHDRYEEINNLMMDPEVTSNSKELTRLAKEQAGAETSHLQVLQAF